MVRKASVLEKHPFLAKSGKNTKKVDFWVIFGRANRKVVNSDFLGVPKTGPILGPTFDSLLEQQVAKKVIPV